MDVLDQCRVNKFSTLPDNKSMGNRCHLKATLSLSVIFFLWVINAQGSSSDSLVVSPTLQMVWPKNLNLTPLHFPSMNGWRLESRKNTNSYSVWISHSSPRILGNIFSIKRYWKKNLAKAPEKGTDLGCKPLSSRTFRCTRTSSRGNSTFAETFIWNAKNDLLVVRVTSNQSEKNAKNILESFDIKLNSRLPASRQK